MRKVAFGERGTSSCADRKLGGADRSSRKQSFGVGPRSQKERLAGGQPPPGQRFVPPTGPYTDSYLNRSGHGRGTGRRDPALMEGLQSPPSDKTWPPCCCCRWRKAGWLSCRAAHAVAVGRFDRGGEGGCAAGLVGDSARRKRKLNKDLLAGHCRAGTRADAEKPRKSSPPPTFANSRISTRNAPDNSIGTGRYHCGAGLVRQGTLQGVGGGLAAGPKGRDVGEPRRQKPAGFLRTSAWRRSTVAISAESR